MQHNRQASDVGLSNRLIKSHMDGKVESPNYMTTVSGRRHKDNELTNSTYSRRSVSEALDMENIESYNMKVRMQAEYKRVQSLMKRSTTEVDLEEHILKRPAAAHNGSFLSSESDAKS